ncbi:hypothetical protein CJF32_00009604 [Rutstroemia sp. NJR-2017a WRK4]|nr:hypothetical protein CJF32_00009604 [Rutstroemia sp. NJR-2017a WRK4]
MLVWKYVPLVVLWVTEALALKQLPERTVSISYNATSTESDGAIVTSTGENPTCCYLSSFQVGQVLWYSKSINITITTISTIVYKYDNTAITGQKTVINTAVLDQASIDGLPTTIIGTDVGVYEASTILVRERAFTDPYGVVYQSPTPVWIYTDVLYATATPTATNSAQLCPNPEDMKSVSADEISPHPSGFFLADDDPSYGWNNHGSISTTLPTQLRDWMVRNPAPSSGALPNLGQCKLGAGRGVPTAYVPVNEVTATILTTSTMHGNYGSAISSTGTGTGYSSSSIYSAPPSTSSTRTTTTLTTQSTTTVSYLQTTTTSMGANFVEVTNVSQSFTTVRSTTTTSSSTTSSTSVVNAATQPISRTTTNYSASTRYVVVGSSTLTVNPSSTFGTGNRTLVTSVATTTIEKTTHLDAGTASIVVVMNWLSTSTEAVAATAVSEVSTPTNTLVVASSKANSGSGLRQGVDVWVGGWLFFVGLMGVWVL